jgi:hypothetical protein
MTSNGGKGGSRGLGGGRGTSGGYPTENTAISGASIAIPNMYDPNNPNRNSVIGYRDGEKGGIGSTTNLVDYRNGATLASENPPYSYTASGAGSTYGAFQIQGFSAYNNVGGIMNTGYISGGGRGGYGGTSARPGTAFVGGGLSGEAGSPGFCIVFFLR